MRAKIEKMGARRGREEDQSEGLEGDEDTANRRIVGQKISLVNVVRHEDRHTHLDFAPPAIFADTDAPLPR